MSSSMSRGMLLLALSCALLAAGCMGEVGVFEEDPSDLSETGDLEPEEQDRSTFTSYSLPIGQTVEVCHVYVGLNNRTGPSTNYMVLRVLPSGRRARTLKRSGNWYRLDISGKIGWSYGRYLCKVGSAAPAAAPAPVSAGSSSTPAAYKLSRDGIINTCKAYVGFSYWWGGADFPNPWSTKGQDRGKCYSSTYSGHKGAHGADCSGFVGKVWQIPSALPFYQNRHPYSTYHFYYQRNYWKDLSRSSAQRADAMVYNGSSGGHILIYESGNPWGQAWTYEARGCAYGVVHNLRTIGSYYRARRRNGV